MRRNPRMEYAEECQICGKPVDDFVPEYCCDGRECGCGGGIRIQHGAAITTWANAEYLAESHARAMVRLERYELMERNVIEAHKRLSDQIQRAGSDGAEFCPIRDLLRDIITN